ncbi:hypothetical protein GGS23DRAFT_487469 [Durotheca rogersii]|uniref:uncharacterized protein n=1 Tax=Durotheca rogersii TaxID=419775 RepID=UPI00221FDD11|nr:uncharacterized protein GGS23DRAFT_487469 [Durotheca rogersii]KAI5864206.1 hypothetical protein GGS23DRAFT_487469 [Durotheca rogersii]
MNKNWNDRADKDLFFTILSVKNIGVISGAEWTTIGNHMRSLGYGFTNEGCRQHFQGLRRAQHKTDTNGNVLDSQRRADPTMNPITRRPGPGRGRPRKQPSASITDLNPTSPSGTPGDGQGVQEAREVPEVREAQEILEPRSVHEAQEAQEAHEPHEPRQVNEPQEPLETQEIRNAELIPTFKPINPPMQLPTEEADSSSLAQEDSTLDEQPSKRPRLGEDNQRRNGDGADLALASDDIPGPGDHFEPPGRYYGEA